MIYALIRGWLAGMAALLIEILPKSAFFMVNTSSFRPGENGVSDTTAISVFCFALLEETMKCVSLRGISGETVPFFRNAIFKGLLVGIGFALFESCIKILFYGRNEGGSVLLGATSGALLHISTGIILGTAWFFRERGRPLFLFAALFFLAVAIHAFYNLMISPFLFARFS